MTPNIKNWRIHPDDQRKLVSSLIDETGWADVTQFNIQTNEFINGHLRRDIAINKGLDRMPVLVLDLTPEQQAKLHAGLDLSTGMAETDTEKLGEILAGFEMVDGDADTILRNLARDLGVATEPEAPEPEPEAPPTDEGPTHAERLAAIHAKWDAQPGQVWGFPSEDGSVQQLAVGDCGDPEIVARLMEGRTAAVVFTSPPYAEQREYGSAGDFDWDATIRGMLDTLPARESTQIFINLAMIYRNHEWVEYWKNFFVYMNSSGWLRFGWYPWDQGHGLPGDHHGRLCPSHEFIFHFNKISPVANKTKPNKTAGEVSEMHHFRNHIGEEVRYNKSGNPEAVHQDFAVPDSVVRINRAGGQGIAHIHSAIYPIGLPDLFIRTYSDPGAIVYDPFVGSGTTLLACAQSGRNGHGIEIHAPYCSLALERFTEAGFEPKLLRS